MTDTGRLAALLDDALRPYLALLRSPDDQNDKIIRGVAARLAAAGVTVTAQPAITLRLPATITREEYENLMEDVRALLATRDKHG